MIFQENVGIETAEGITEYKLIAVHAGLEKKRGVEEQLTYLKARDTSIPKVEALSGRENVWDMPEVHACSYLIFPIFRICWCILYVDICCLMFMPGSE